MAKPRRVSALSSVLKETQEYNKVTQEDEQVIPIEQETVKTEKQISVDTDKHLAVEAETQKPVNTEEQKTVNADKQEAAYTETQNSVNTDVKLHKQTIAISEDLAFRLKVHAARRKETIANIATRAFEKLLTEEETE